MVNGNSEASNTGARQRQRLRRTLWIDALLRGLNGLVGTMFSLSVSDLFGLPRPLVVTVALITLAYGVIAFGLARRASPPIPLVRFLVWANWFWTAVSVVLLFAYASSATLYGQIFLILQIAVVGGLAYLEGRQTHPTKAVSTVEK